VPRARLRRKERTGLEKGDISAFLSEGEKITGVYAIVRSADRPVSSQWTPTFDFLLFVSLTGMRGYFPVMAAEGHEQRIFKSFDRLLRMLRELGYHGPITTYDDADPRRPAEPTGVTRRRPGERLATLPPSTKAKTRS
jgi:hypothetical protein